MKCEYTVDSETLLLDAFQQDENSYHLGPSYRSIERDKFKYKPYQAYNAAPDVAVGANSTYWDTYANYQIKHFKDYIVGDFKNKPWKQTKIQPEPGFRTE